MTLEGDTLQTHIPYYLTADPAKKVLLGELDALINGAENGYFISPKFDPYANSFLQGDILTGFQVFSFKSGERITIRGITLSNSCDISEDNQRDLPPKITFAPIVKLSNYASKLERGGVSSDRIDSKLFAIRKQRSTNMFYLPNSGGLEDEYVAVLSDMHSMPVAELKTSEKLFTLSNAGFYLFLFKLSVHFCRFHENIDRSASNTAE